MEEENKGNKYALLSTTLVYISSMDFYLNKYSLACVMKYLYLEIKTLLNGKLFKGGLLGFLYIYGLL
jgi:hypothetical protein